MRQNARRFVKMKEQDIVDGSILALETLVIKSVMVGVIKIVYLQQVWIAQQMSGSIRYGIVPVL